MKRYKGSCFFISLATLLVFFIGCESNKNTIINTKVKKITKEERFKKLYLTKVIPLFNEFNEEVEIPEEFKVDKKDNSVNAGAAFGYIEVSQGLVNYTKEHLQIFTLAHELGHTVTLAQAKKFELGNQIPTGVLTNDYKKSEFLADLLAVYLINKHLPKEMRLIEKDFYILKNLLGYQTFTHPSGTDRVEMMKVYLRESKINPQALEKFFRKIWEKE